MYVTLLSPHLQNQENGHTSTLHPKKWFLILLNCAILKFVSYTSNLLEQMCDFQKRTCSTRRRFWVLKISCKIGVLKHCRYWTEGEDCSVHPFVSLSASWFLVSTYLISIFRSKLVLPLNQSSATLLVRDTCLIVGLLPLMIILITALSSYKTT